MLIKYYFLRGKIIKETEKKLEKYYKDSAPSHEMVHKWFTEFRCGRTSTSDAEHSGCPKEVTTQDVVNKIHDIIVKISTERVFYILHVILGMRKLSAS